MCPGDIPPATVPAFDNLIQQAINFASWYLRPGFIVTSLLCFLTTLSAMFHQIVVNLNAKIHALQSEVDRLTESSITAARERVRQELATFNLHQQQVDSLRASLSASQTREAESAARADKSEQETVELRSQLQTLQEAVEKVQQEKQEAEDRWVVRLLVSTALAKAVRRAEVAEAVAPLMVRIWEAVYFTDALEDQLGLSLEKVEALKQQVRQETAAVTALQVANGKLQRQLLHSHEQVAVKSKEVDRLAAQAASLQGEMAQLDLQLSNTQQQLTETLQELTNAQQQVAELQAKPMSAPKAMSNSEATSALKQMLKLAPASASSASSPRTPDLGAVAAAGGFGGLYDGFASSQYSSRSSGCSSYGSRRSSGGSSWASNSGSRYSSGGWHL